jgi:YidC/Oxa1 family membrane protein insertase
MIASLLAGPLSPLENVLRHLLDFFHNSVGLPWGWAVVALTILVRICLVPLVVRQIHSMQNLQAHAPQMKEIQRKYKGDRQKMNEELMKFYKDNNINPAASCLPLLAQFPIFISLFYVLRQFANHPPGGDLSWLGVVPSIAAPVLDHWAGYLLLFIYAASQIASTYFMSATMDKTQRYIMMVLPIAFIPLIAHFPTGLVLYWMTTNLWTVGQGLVTRRLAPKPSKNGGSNGVKRTSRTPPKNDQPKPDGDGDGDGDGATTAVASSPPAEPAQPRVVRRKKTKHGRR